MDAKERELIWSALRELHSAVTDLKTHAEQSAPVDLGRNATEANFAPIDTALRKAGEAINGIHRPTS